ncbi:BgtTE-56102 [Blumeria graminis f. sp. tritici]|uniref:BgtTE-56102 n=1 Tax=Blumeria graminis f. sp. tritici TaxID=62690 RepID=A0A9X9MMB3_BLUGR|nr:BgtTE-56102 [Blumeria graminis f. sp. tritici]
MGPHFIQFVAFYTFLASDFSCVCSYLARAQYRTKSAGKMTQYKRRVLMPQILFANTTAKLW